MDYIVCIDVDGAFTSKIKYCICGKFSCIRYSKNAASSFWNRQTHLIVTIKSNISILVGVFFLLYISDKRQCSSSWSFFRLWIHNCKICTKVMWKKRSLHWRMNWEKNISMKYEFVFIPSHLVTIRFTFALLHQFKWILKVFKNILIEYMRMNL